MNTNNERSKVDHVDYECNHKDTYKHITTKTKLSSCDKDLSNFENQLVLSINKYFRIWYKPWIKAYLQAEKDFYIIFELMENLLHYELQLKTEKLTQDRVNTISKSVARLIDYGNAILNLDLIIRNESLIRVESTHVTTVELFNLHVQADKFRKKLLQDYLHPKRSLINPDCDNNEALNKSTLYETTSPEMDLHLPFSFGGALDALSINPPSPSEKVDLRESADMRQMLDIIHSTNFMDPKNTALRTSYMLSIMHKIPGFMDRRSIVAVNNCFELIDSLIETIEKLPPNSLSSEISILANGLLKPLVDKVLAESRDDIVEYQLAHWTTILLSLLKLVMPSKIQTYLHSFTSTVDLSVFLKDFLFIVRRQVAANRCEDLNKGSLKNEFEINQILSAVFPNYWIQMNLDASKIYLNSLVCIRDVIVKNFSSHIPIWQSYIDCLISILSQDFCKPRRAMLSSLHEATAFNLKKYCVMEIQATWNCLGSTQKEKFNEELIELLLTVCLFIEEEFRGSLLCIIRDMAKCNYYKTYVAPKLESDSSQAMSKTDLVEPSGWQYQSLQQYQVNSEALPYLSSQGSESQDSNVLAFFRNTFTKIMFKLLICNELGDESFKNQLYDSFTSNQSNREEDSSHLNQSDEDKNFLKALTETAHLLKQFLQICFDLRLAKKSNYTDLHTLCLSKLIDLFKNSSHLNDLHLECLYRLYQELIESKRSVEASFVLLEHAKLLSWNRQPLDGDCLFLNKRFRNQHVMTDNLTLKEYLYTTIIENFDNAQLWEYAVDMCRELADVYQNKTYEFEKLSAIHLKLSSFFKNITDISRPKAEYYRVSFYGKGYPLSLQNLTVVYKGQSYQMLDEFQKSILEKFPESKLFRSLADPSLSMLKSEDRYIQINPCQPIVNLKSKFDNVENLSDLDDSIVDFYRNNSCNTFCYSRRLQSTNSKSSDDFSGLWREKATLFTTNLPGLLPFSIVHHIELCKLNPIENAIDDIQQTNNRLRIVVHRFRVGKEKDERILTRDLLGIIDAAVNGGITKYEEAFFKKNTLNKNTLHVPNSQSLVNQYTDVENQSINKLKRLIAAQLPLLEEGLSLHSNLVTSEMQPQHDYMEEQFKSMKRHILNEYSSYLPPEYRRRSSMRTLRKLSSQQRSPIRPNSFLLTNQVNSAQRHTANSTMVANRNSSPSKFLSSSSRAISTTFNLQLINSAQNKSQP